MKILMLGWELPPRISGGLGVASQGLAEGLASIGNEVVFLLPRKRKGHDSPHFKIVDASKIQLNPQEWKKKTYHSEIIRKTELGTRLVPYLPPEIFEIAKERQVTIEKVEDRFETDLLDKVRLTGKYLDTIQAEISKYALLAAQYAKKHDFDLLHAHDWVTYKAGVVASKETKIPLYVHCHSTEHDRNGAFAQRFVIDEEKHGFSSAKKIFSVSQKLKDTIVDQYKIPGKKVVVVPNAPDLPVRKKSGADRRRKKVLFVGRFTHQKNPGKFVDIARDLISKGHDCKFSMIGDGYLKEELESKVNQNNLGKYFEFPGFLERDKVIAELHKSDLLITPSSSEPFGLVILEAIQSRVPVATVTGVGIAEFIPSLPQVALWDHYNYVKMAESLLYDEGLRRNTIEKCLVEAEALNWPDSARKVQQNYQL